MAFSSTIARALAILAAVWLVGAPAAAKETLVFHYIGIENDSRYEVRRAYTGLTLLTRHRPIDGVKTALRESRVLARAVGAAFKLEETTLSKGGDAGDFIARAIEAGGRIFLLDLPAAAVERLTSIATERDDILLFNLRAEDDSLRRLCAPGLLHVGPSRAMLSDALAQYLYKMKWRDVLVLVGPTEADATVAESFQGAAEKFGLRIVEVKPFTLSRDPRRRDQNNIALLTTGPSYDAVFIADTVGEFGRYVAFATVLPRPVVGSVGLKAEAWHWTWERHGAPQLNQRFDRIAERRMTSDDWAGWAAVKSVVEGVTRLKTVSVAEIRSYLLGNDFVLDTYKGAQGAFRAWSGQLRQPILLATHNAVIERAPIEGFLHPTNNLDTLGLDEPLSPCRQE